VIYVKGLDALERQLDAFGLTKSPESADCAVVQMPGNADILVKLPAGLPVLVVVNGMMSLADTRAVRKTGAKVVKEEELATEIQSLQKEEPEVDSEEDDIISFDEEESQVEPVRVNPPKAVKPEPVRRPVNPAPRQEVRQPRQEARPAPEPKPIQEDEPKVPIMRLKPTINKDTYEPVYEPEVKPQEKVMRETPRRQILNPRTTRGIIVTSYSSSGGVGKTFMACNVSALCATQNVSSVLVDLDLGFGNIDVETGLVDEVERNRVVDKKTTPKSNWATVTDWRKHAVDLKSNTLRHNSGLYVVPSFPYAGKELRRRKLRTCYTRSPKCTIS
jgi:Mrp family chromosome partitioning ATPase